MSMKIIGHRGAASLALENTLASIRAASSAGVDGIEFDVRLTADGQFVLAHDADFSRMSNDERPISEMTLAEATKIKLENGETPPSLQTVLEMINETMLYIEPKGDGWAIPLAKLLQTQIPNNVNVIAMDGEELATFHLLLPEVPTYLVQPFNLVDTFYAAQQARAQGFRGVDYSFWQLNPLAYFLCKWYRLEIIVYTVNRTWIARFLSVLFSGISITTDRPQDMQFLRPRKIRRN